MKTRESGMPEEARWKTFFDPDFILTELGLEEPWQAVVDMGCGYGTFSIEAARRISGMVHAMDIDPQMVEACQARAKESGVANIDCVERDFVTDGACLPDDIVDFVMLFNILHAEEVFALGCELLISITSAGQISQVAKTPYFFVIEKALRDEGTSYHYLPPSQYSEINPQLNAALKTIFQPFQESVLFGASWTTDAPFRETEASIAFRKEEGILGVEMEAATLYAFSLSRSKPVICIAQITNQMGQVENDFEKGSANIDALAMFALIAKEIRTTQVSSNYSG
jgi:SAM-dependent methyltransferase